MESDQTKSTAEDASEADDSQRIEPGLKQTAVTSTISFVCGVGALLSLVLVHPAMILSLPAILFGHIAKANLKQSNGDLVGWGKARIGKLLGYFCLAVSVWLFFNLESYRLMVRGAMNSERTAVVKAGQDFDDGRLGEIERKLTDGDTRDFGNNEIAGDLAFAFRRELRKALNSVLTHRDNKGLGLDTSGISCYCDVDGGVVFIAAVPELSQYSGAADEVLRKSVWQSAVLAMRESEFQAADGEEQLVIGLMESTRCETVLIGTLSSQFDGVPGPEREENDGSQIAQMLNE